MTEREREAKTKKGDVEALDASDKGTGGSVVAVRGSGAGLADGYARLGACKR